MKARYKIDKEGVEWYQYKYYIETIKKNKDLYSQVNNDRKTITNLDDKISRLTRKYSSAKEELEALKKAIRKIFNISFEGKLTNEPSI